MNRITPINKSNIYEDMLAEQLARILIEICQQEKKRSNDAKTQVKLSNEAL